PILLDSPGRRREIIDAVAPRADFSLHMVMTTHGPGHRARRRDWPDGPPHPHRPRAAWEGHTNQESQQWHVPPAP
ncbi:MAG: hypothetical protein KC489_13730, partial [Gemmatimonadetes bacterium]|nr:hypothetical protein [Gemmatimonadota bacterium]